MPKNSYSIPIDFLQINIALYERDKDDDFIFFDLNTMAQKTEKLNKKELIGKKVIEVFPGIKDMGLYDVFCRVYKSGISEVFDITHYEDDRTSGWRKNTVSKIDDKTIMAAYEDVTYEVEIKDALIKTEESKNFYINLVDSLNDWIWEVDINGVYTYCNKQVFAILGYTPQEIVGKTPFDFMAKEEGQRVGEIFISYVKEKKIFKNLYNEHIHKDGHTVYLSTNGLPLLDSNGELLGYRGVDRDISNDIKLKKEKEIQHKKMLEQSRHAQMGEMISMIAHQWRQPLASISITSIDLSMQIELENFDLKTIDGQVEQNKYFSNSLETINTLVQNLTTTIDDFRNFYKPNKETTEVTFEDVTSKAIKIMQSTFSDEDIKITYDYSSNKKHKMFYNEMMQVILNLLKNAQDNFKEKQTKSPEIIISTTDEYLSITDNGGGIEENIIDKIFDPYFSTKNKKNGTGLGLYMSKTIIDDHHYGKLKAINTDNGVCFRISLEL